MRVSSYIRNVGAVVPFLPVILLVLAISLLLTGCHKRFLMMTYGDNPFKPSFAEESMKDAGGLTKTKYRVYVFEVTELKPDGMQGAETAWYFTCISQKNIKQREIIYGVVPQGCDVRTRASNLKPNTIYSVSGSFNKGSVTGGGVFSIVNSIGEFHIKYHTRGNYQDWLELLNVK